MLIPSYCKSYTFRDLILGVTYTVITLFQLQFETNKRQKKGNLFHLNVAFTIVFNMWKKGEKRKTKNFGRSILYLYNVAYCASAPGRVLFVHTVSIFLLGINTRKTCIFRSMQTRGRDNLSDFF